MSTRTDLVDALAAALDPAVYRVVGTPDVPDVIEVDTFAVRVWAKRIAPGPTSGSVQVDLVVWVLTAKQAPGDTDDALDVALDEVVGALYGLSWLTPATAERGVMDDNEGPRWHGWRVEASAFGLIDTSED